MSNEGKHPANNNGHRPEYQNGPQKNNQRNTVIALSVATCLFMCMFGYQIIQLNKNKVPPAPIKGPTSEPVRRNTYQEPVASHFTDDDEYLSYELKILREQNRRQASKIKSLKQEIVNRLQEQHDLKSTLFKQEGDPRDKARIAELNHQLSQKEMVTMQLQHQLKELEVEKQTFDKKMLHAEVTKEALTNMLEEQRVIRDREISKLRNHIANIEKQKDQEHKELTTKLLQFEDTHQRLQDTLEETSYATFYLDSEIKHLKDELVDSHKTRKEIENTLLEQLYNTIASLELTEVETATLRNKLKGAYLRHNKSLKENNGKIAQLEREIDGHRKHIKEKNVLFDSIHDLYSVALIQTKSEIDEVSNHFEEEKNKSQSLEHELAKQLEIRRSLQQDFKTLKKDHRIALEVEKKLDETNKKMTFLQAELDVHKFSIAEREKHLDQLHQGKIALETKYQDKIQELSKTLQTEQQKKSTMELEIDYLAGKLELENARHQSTKGSLTTLEKNLNDLEDQLKYAARTEEELEISNRKAATLQLELERQHALLTAKEQQIGSNLQKEQEAISRLEKELESNKIAVDAKHQQLISIENSKKDLEAQLHGHIATLTSELEQERAYINSLETQLQSTNDQLEKEKSAHETTRMTLIDLNGTQKSLNDQHRYSVNLEKKLEESKCKLSDLESELDLHQGLLETKDYHLQSIVKKQSDEVARLERELARNQAELEEKHQTLHLSTSEQQKNERELTQKIAALSELLSDEKIKHKNVTSNLQQELEQQSRRVAALESERDSLKKSLEQEISAHTYVKTSLEDTRLALIDQNSTQDLLNEQHRYSTRLEKSLDDSKAKADQLESQLNRLSTQLEANEQHYSKLLESETGKLSSLQQQQETTKNALASKTREIERLHEELSLQISLTESYEQRVKDLQNHENEQIAQLRASIGSYEELVSSKERTLHEYKQHEEQIRAGLMSEISELMDNSQRESQQSSHLRDQLHEIEAQYAAEQSKSHSIQNRLQNSEQTVLTLELELQQFHQERERTSDRIADLEVQLNDLLKATRAKETADAKRFEKFNHR